ncbi:Na+/H+ antiporter NhaC family protein [candidate division KSB1 bacterium]
MKKRLIINQFFLILVFFPIVSFTQDNSFDNDLIEYTIEKGDVNVIIPDIIMCGLETEITLEFNDLQKSKKIEGQKVHVIVNQKHIVSNITEGKIIFPYTFESKEELKISSGSFFFNTQIRPISLWLSVLPPLIAILIALLFKEVFTALVIGIFIGGLIIYLHHDISIFAAVFSGLLAVIDTYVIESLINRDHVPIIVFSMLIGAMVNLITANGGMKGVVNVLSRFAKNARSGSFITWLLGILIFFDDYANTLVVGNTMRPVTDRLKISREKLSYIVDSTAAPIAAIAFVTTWIGAELSYIQNGINTLGMDESPYNIFISSLQYSFYPVFALLFIPILIKLGRDYGPMLHAEQRVKKDSNYYLVHDNRCEPVSSIISGVKDERKKRWYNAVIPVIIIIFGTIIGLIYTGLQEVAWDKEVGIATNLSSIIGHSDSFNALLWASFMGVIVAILMTLSQRLLSLKDSINSLVNGFKTMITAILILILAWSLALVTEHLHTAEYLSYVLVSIQITPYLIPALTFIIAALVSFSTGSSWGTMAILYPLILPASWLISIQSGLSEKESMAIFHNVVSTVLAGSVFGDHCSPISDTTILSSLASSCNHIEHVRTQLPYALTVGVIAIIIGTIPAAYGISSIILMPVGIILLYLIVRIFGKKVDPQPDII